ncbi:MAG: nuclear transport factor 2 family protein [Acidobacteriaceae bacterium]|nr:nuclear transport factor 2 family protein [Acidobacteriaceae bacterium]
MKSILFFSITLLAVDIVGCGTARRDSVAENKSVVLRSEKELWSSGNLAVADELYSPDFVCHFIVGPEWRGIQGIKNEVRQHGISFPDWNERVDDIVAEGLSNPVQIVPQLRALRRPGPLELRYQQSF